MNDEDIKKALECCISLSCEGCPLKNNHGCLTISDENALDLINRQQAEIERLQKYNTEVTFKHYDDGRIEAIKECVNKYTEMLIIENSMSRDIKTE